MSARKLSLRLSPEADDDLAHILLHSKREWGDAHRSHYRALIYQAFRRIGSFPSIGLPRDELFDDCRSLMVEQHIIYYYQSPENVIVVARILHGRQSSAVVAQCPISDVD